MMTILALSIPALAGAPAEPAPLHADHQPLMPLVEEAAEAHGVPAMLLAALAWEATRLDPYAASAWAGYGPLDLREDGAPNVEEAAILLDVSPDLLIADAGWNLRGGAALLADQANRLYGALPPVDDLEAWYEAVRVFSGHHDPAMQDLFGQYIFELLYVGVEGQAPSGELVRFGGVPIDLPALTALHHDLPPLSSHPGDYYGNHQFISAHSSNFTSASRTGSNIQYVVVHTVQGSYAGCISWFQNSSANVSAHYVIRSSDGQVTQMVREKDIGWHAGNWTYNQLSIGIEHEGWVEAPETWYTDAMYASSAELVRDVVNRTAVTADRSKIIAHSEVPGATHTDPGPGWDWDHYMALITGSYTVAATLHGVVAAEDVFTGERITDATVWIESTGETSGTNSSGIYTFNDLPTGTYTVHATAPGYDQASCTREISTNSTYWCSIALMPVDEPEPDPDPDPDPDPGDDEPPGDDQVPGDDEEVYQPPTASAGPGGRVRHGEAKGCDVGGGVGLGLGWLLGGLLLGRRRR